MGRKVIAFWLSLAMVLSFIVVLDVMIDFTPPVKGGIIRYVNETGSGGAYTKIQDAINASNDGDTVFVYNGTYYEHVVVNKTINLTGEDKNSTIIDGSGSGDVVLITSDLVNVTGFTMKNCGMQGTPAYDSGIDVRSEFNNIIGNIVINNNYGICLYQTSNNCVTDNDIYFNNWAGILLESSSNNNITLNNVSSTNWEGIWVYSSSNNNIIAENILFDNKIGVLVNWDSNNNTIKDNFVSNNNETGIYIYRTYGNNIINNNVSNNVWDGIYLFDSFNSYVASNHFTNNGIFIQGDVISHYNSHEIPNNNIVNDELLYFYKDCNNVNVDGISVGQIIIANCSGVNISNLSINNTDVGIEAAYSTNVTIYFNNVSLNNRDGMFLYELSNSKILHNYAMFNAYFGIYLSSSSYNKVTNNNASYNMGGIVVIFSSHNNTITCNRCNSNRNFGIYVGGDSIDNLIINNNVSSGNRYGIWLSSSATKNHITYNIAMNNEVGIYIWNSYKNNITNNNLWNNDEGIKLQSSLNQWIYHNNIINNTKQASDDSNNNYWDNGYPSGGNYWSNFDEPTEGAYDDYQGPNQAIVGSDGIVDNGTAAGGGKNTYVIDSDSKDNYPLMKPYENYIILWQGWNLISIPLIQIEQNLTKVLERINGYYNAVQWYDVIDTNDSWKHHKVGKPYGNDLFKLNETMGFWIHIIQPGDTIFLYNGTQPTSNQTITLHPGWNLVGYPSLKSYNRTEGLNNLTFGPHVDAIWTYNAATQKWKEIGPSDYFKVGRGYWIHAKTKCEWEVPL